MTDTRVLVSGWRSWPVSHHRIVVDALDWYLQHIWDQLTGKLIVVHGAATGADTFADQWARASDNAVPEAHPADWPNCGPDCPTRPHRRRNKLGREFCPFAGNRRNAHMVSLGASYSLAFPGPEVPGKESGTRNCMKHLKAAGIECRPYSFRPTPTQLEIA